jgi:hypothetical protein
MKMAITKDSSIKALPGWDERSVKESYTPLARMLEEEQRFAQEYKRKSARGEYDPLQKRRAEEARQTAELAMPHNVCSISVAVDLWTVQFGDGWVAKRNIAEIVDPGNMNWTRLARRLYDVNRMEDQNEHWRIVT